MSEDETTVERTAGSETGESTETSVTETGTVTASGAESTRSETEFDRAAESFLELEADLDGLLAGADDVDVGQFRGLVVDADRVDADAVPQGYPVDVRTDRALALRVDRGGDETTVYLEWPGDAGGESPLAWLLTTMDADLSDLYGREVLLEQVESHDTLVVPSEAPRGSDRWWPAVAVGHGLNVALLALSLATGGLSTPLFGLWALLTAAGLPYATYRDAWYVRTHSDWRQGPLFWATLSMVPGVNALVGFSYLWTRSRARFFGTERSLVERAVGTVRPWL